MTRWWHSHSVRVRLTLWYVAAMIVVLGVYAAVVFVFVSRNTSETLNRRIRGDFQWAAAMVDHTEEGGFSWPEGVGEDESPWLQIWDLEGNLLFQNAEARSRPLPQSRDLALKTDDSLVSLEGNAVA